MRRLFIVIMLLMDCILCNSKSCLRLSDGRIVENTETVKPQRKVESVDDGIIVTYKFTNVILNDDKSCTDAINVTIEGFNVSDELGEPAVLFRSEVFFIPVNDTPRIEITSCSYIDIPLKLAPAKRQNANTVRISHDELSKQSITPYSGFFPETVVKEACIQSYKGQRMMMVNVSPFQYDYQNHIIRFYKTLEYKVSFNNLNRSKRIKVAKNDQFLKKMLTENQRSFTEAEDTIQHYLILTVPKYTKAVERFSEWKKYLGYQTHIIVKNAQDWTPDSIKHIAKNMYNNNDTSFYYMLIVGDNEDIPGESKSFHFSANNFNDTVHYVTDHYYSCMDDSIVSPFGFSYKDCAPDIHVGRLPVSTEEEAMVVVNKIIEYESNPVDGYAFYKTFLHCAEFADEDNDGYEDIGYQHVAGSEYISDYVYNHNLILDPLKIYTTYSNASPLLMSNSTPAPTAFFYEPWDNLNEMIAEYINDGVYYVLYISHGETWNWVMPNFETADILTLNNGKKLPIVFSFSCLTGKYNGRTCFAERFIQKENGGCVAIFAASDISFAQRDNTMAKGVFDAIWPVPGLFGVGYTSAAVPMYSLGQILDWSKYRLVISWYNSFSGISAKNLYNIELYHCFGDPSMLFHTENPRNFNNVTIDRTTGKVDVSIGNDTARIAFYDKVDNRVVVHEGSNATYYGDETHVTVCLSGHNKRPYIDEGTIYIQNDTLENTSTYKARTIKVGTNVTNNISQGPVFFRNGKTTLIGNTIELNGETTVANGAELEIRNQ